MQVCDFCGFLVENGMAFTIAVLLYKCLSISYYVGFMVQRHFNILHFKERENLKSSVCETAAFGSFMCSNPVTLTDIQDSYNISR